MPVQRVMAEKLGLPENSTDIRDQRRTHRRFDWRGNLLLRVQLTEQVNDPYKEYDVITHDLGVGGFSYLSKSPMNRNTAVLACMPHLEKDRCVIGKVRYCHQEVGLQYRIGVKFIQRVDVVW